MIGSTGYYDCVDWEDEYYDESGEWCSFEPNSMECDEHICRRDMYSCGDGQCVSWPTRVAFQRFIRADKDCFNKRNLNYMCEASPHQRAWTLESGLCWPEEGYDDPRYPSWDMMNSSNLTDGEKCQYLFRCVLSQGYERDCPCDHHNCTEMMTHECPSKEFVLYPSQGLISPNLFYYYRYNQSMENPSFDVFKIGGNLKCHGYYATSEEISPVPQLDFWMVDRPHINRILCILNNFEDDLSSFQYDKFCWNESLTFNSRPYAVTPHVCNGTIECISHYRIRDGMDDCLNPEDESGTFKEDYCTGNVKRHRFQCFNDQHKCLPLSALSTGTSDCLNGYDERYYGTGVSLRTELQCSKVNTVDCGRLKEYIRQSSNSNSSSNSLSVNLQEQKLANQMPFRSYCDSFWDLERHIDELNSSCQYWVCQKHQYRCRTGQCIELDWVCDGEWDCADASDEEALVFIGNWSIHNARLSDFTSRRDLCHQRYSQSPFSQICNTSFEFGCYLAGVLEPLDIKLNHPCINISQIGDGVEDCYNAYDERNTFEANLGMWGSQLRCGSDAIEYGMVCRESDHRGCATPLCSYYRDKDGLCSDYKDALCLKDNLCKKNRRCDGHPDCSYGEDEYWCTSGSYENQFTYRFDKKSILMKASPSFLLPSFPPVLTRMSNRQQVEDSIANLRNDSFSTMYSYQCNRGVAILEMNETRCLCPPAYYGRWCEFFSDRISIIAHIDQKTLPKTLLNVDLKIKTNFLFNNTIIDHHEFRVIPTIEKVKNIKHKFYLLYSRSDQMLEHKRGRYFNGTDVINNHPYSVHFDVFSLEKNDSIGELGSWHYPIYFDYLPSFRLAVVLRFPSWFGNATRDPCFENICSANSTCMPIFNKNNTYYCSCKNGYFGKDCGMYERRCETYCSVNAVCRREHYDLHPNKNNLYCICPLGRFGLSCSLKYDDCDTNFCLNNGTCRPNHDISGEASYVCVCSKRFHGDRCQNKKAAVHVDLNMTNVFSARATVVQLYHVGRSLNLRIEHQQVYHGLPSTIQYDHADAYAPSLGFLKIYQDIAVPQYFIMYNLNRTIINITSSPQPCPYVWSLVSKG